MVFGVSQSKEICTLSTKHTVTYEIPVKANGSPSLAFRKKIGYPIIIGLPQSDSLSQFLKQLQNTWQQNSSTIGKIPLMMKIALFFSGKIIADSQNISAQNDGKTFQVDSPVGSGEVTKNRNFRFLRVKKGFQSKLVLMVEYKNTYAVRGVLPKSGSETEYNWIKLREDDVEILLRGLNTFMRSENRFPKNETVFR